MTAVERFELYRAIKQANPDAGPDQRRALYRTALRAARGGAR